MLTRPCTVGHVRHTSVASKRQFSFLQRKGRVTSHSLSLFPFEVSLFGRRQASSGHRLQPPPEPLPRPRARRSQRVQAHHPQLQAQGGRRRLQVLRGQESRRRIREEGDSIHGDRRADQGMEVELIEIGGTRKQSPASSRKKKKKKNERASVLCNAPLSRVP